MIANLLVAWIVYTILVRVVKTSANKAFIVAVSIVILEAGFGISPQDIWHQVMYLPQSVSQTTTENK